jgi:hypothetical protein
MARKAGSGADTGGFGAGGEAAGRNGRSIRYQVEYGLTIVQPLGESGMKMLQPID